MGAADTHSTLQVKQTELFEALCDCRGRGRKENAEKEEIEAEANERRRPEQDATPLQQEGEGAETIVKHKQTRKQTVVSKCLSYCLLKGSDIQNDLDSIAKELLLLK